jgi:ABC-type xylose transport system permease subunit
MINRLQQVFAGMLVALGVLWSLQGAGVVHVKPILCVADCTELQGASGQWLATGIGAVAVGLVLWYLARRRAKKLRTASK